MHICLLAYFAMCHYQSVVSVLVVWFLCSRYELTGGSLNPARSFGPLVILWDTTLWNDHYVYWLGPLLGAAIAGGLHRLILSDRPLIPLYSVEEQHQSQQPEPIQ